MFMLPMKYITPSTTRGVDARPRSPGRSMCQSTERSATFPSWTCVRGLYRFSLVVLPKPSQLPAWASDSSASATSSTSVRGSSAPAPDPGTDSVQPHGTATSRRSERRAPLIAGQDRERGGSESDAGPGQRVRRRTSGGVRLMAVHSAGGWWRSYGHSRCAANRRRGAARRAPGRVGDGSATSTVVQPVPDFQSLGSQAAVPAGDDLFHLRLGLPNTQRSGVAPPRPALTFAPPFGYFCGRREALDKPGASMSADNRIRVTLRWIQIKDSHDLDGEGEFRFHTKVSSGGQTQELGFPDPPAFYRISDNPRLNKVDKLDKVLYEGEAGETLLVELFGTEHDTITPNDLLEGYRREFSGPVSSWLGRYQPMDEGPDDPENLTDWRVCYDIEMA